MSRVVLAVLCGAAFVNPAPFSGSRELPGSLETGTRETARSETKFVEQTFGAQSGRTQKKKT